MKTTHHSEVGTLKSVFIKKPQHAFISEDKITKEWSELNFLEKPDLKLAIEEYTKFEEFLKSSGATIHYLPEKNELSMDSIYCRDASIATNFGMIICNMGKAGRMLEPQAEKEAFEIQGIPILGEITHPGTIEGGDLAWLDEQTLAVGHTYRTNEEGIKQLRQLLEPKGVQVLSFSLPHYKGENDVFHLMSILSPVDTDLAVVYSPLMPISLRNELINRGMRLIEVPDEEFESMGCNVLALAPRKCLMVKGNSLTKKRLQEAGCNVMEYEGNEISVKGGGGPTCLTRPLEREKI
jgi:N-dimethylarginine dimethylaminohydrolase